MTKAQGPVKNSHQCFVDDPEVAYERGLQRMKAAGLRLTDPRRKMWKQISRQSGPFSTEELHSKLNRARQSGCDLATVYRSLASFVEIGLLHSCEFGDGIARFERTTGDGGHHHHVICKACHKVEALTACNIEPAQDGLAAKGYTELNHRLEFFGLCPDCS